MQLDSSICPELTAPVSMNDEYSTSWNLLMPFVNCKYYLNIIINICIHFGMKTSVV